MALKLWRRGKGKNWYLRGTISGSSYYESTGTASKQHAEVKRLKREKEILDREYLGEERTSTWSEAVLVYLEKGGEKRYLTPLTERWGNWLLTKITPSEVSKASRELYPDREASTIKRQLYTPINAVMRAARKAKMAPYIHFDPPKVKRKPVEYADDRWFELFFPAAHFQIAAFVLVLTNGGIRVTELCFLRPEDVLKATSEIILRKTKSGKSRRVPVDAVTLQAILTAVDVCSKEIDDEVRVFGYASRWSVNQAIERVCDRVNVAAGAVRIESIKFPNGQRRYKRHRLAPLVLRYLSSHRVGRHAFAARLLSQGRSLKFVQGGGGWASIQIVADIYGHLEQSETDQAVRDGGLKAPALPAPPSERQKPNARRIGAKSVQTRKRPAKRRG